MGHYFGWVGMSGGGWENDLGVFVCVVGGRRGLIFRNALKKFIFSNVYVSMNTIFECLYVFLVEKGAIN